jgi:hypothetical protein
MIADELFDVFETIHRRSRRLSYGGAAQPRETSNHAEVVAGADDPLEVVGMIFERDGVGIGGRAGGDGP